MTRGAHTIIMFHYHHNKIYIIVLICDHFHMHSYACKYAFTLHHYLTIPILRYKGMLRSIRFDLSIGAQDFCLITSDPRCLMPCNCSILLHRRGHSVAVSLIAYNCERDRLWRDIQSNMKSIPRCCNRLPVRIPDRYRLRH